MVLAQSRRGKPRGSAESAHGDGALLAPIDAGRALAALINLDDGLFAFHDDGAGGTGLDAIAATFTFL
jgi:hypothetical protein